MQMALWLAVLVLAVFTMEWGADQIARPLKKLRKTWGLTQAGSAPFIALATASPEAMTNAISAVRGVEHIGLGNLLGSNIISVPAIVTVSYLAANWGRGRRADPSGQKGGGEGDGRIEVEPEAFKAQAVPYALIALLVAALTIPEPWRGLQPIDGWIVLAAFVAYFAYAVLLHRDEGEDESWSKREVVLALFGAGLLGAAAFFAVTATERLAEELGIAKIIAALFITATVSVTPELFAAWHVARSGQTSAATTSVCADNTLTATLGFFPLALVGVAIPDKQFFLFWINMAAVVAFAALVAVLMRFGSRPYGFDRREVLLLNAAYLLYAGVIVFGIVTGRIALSE